MAQRISAKSCCGADEPPPAYRVAAIDDEM